MARLYITENNKDQEYAKRLAEALHKRGHIVSVDVNFLVPGEEWKRSIREESAASDGIIALLTANSVRESSNIVSSQWVAADIGAARAAGKFVIPLVIGPDVRIPALIDDLLVIKLDSFDDLDKAVLQVDDAVRIHMDKRKAADLYLASGFEHLASGVRRFQEDFAYEASVFVMMKYPDPITMKPEDLVLLEDIWSVVDRVLGTYRLKARRADKRTYYDQLWENICIYMLGSKYGLAILEDRVAGELNPNVTLEYGFMRALNRQVVLLRDIQFKHDRADLTGKLSKPFEIDEAKLLKHNTLAQAIQDWLLDLGLQARQQV